MIAQSRRRSLLASADAAALLFLPHHRFHAPSRDTRPGRGRAGRHRQEGECYDELSGGERGDGGGGGGYGVELGFLLCFLFFQCFFVGWASGGGGGVLGVLGLPVSAWMDGLCFLGGKRWCCEVGGVDETLLRFFAWSGWTL